MHRSKRGGGQNRYSRTATLEGETISSYKLVV